MQTADQPKGPVVKIQNDKNYKMRLLYRIDLIFVFVFVLPYTDICMKHCMLSAFRVSVGEKNPQGTRAGIEPTLSCLLVQNS